MLRIGVAGDICLRRPRPTLGCRSDDDDDDDDDLDFGGRFASVVYLFLCFADRASQYNLSN